MVQPIHYTFIGTEGDDVFMGTGGWDSTGPKGNDLILGLGGNDYLCGSSGHDEIHGGDGDDLIDGYKGADELWGDAGVDTFYWGYSGFSRIDRPNLMDTVFDFETGADKVDISALGVTWSDIAITAVAGGFLVEAITPQFGNPDWGVLFLGVAAPVESDFIL